MHFTITSSRSVTTGHFHTVKIPYYMWITNNWSLWSAEELHHLHVHLSLNNGGSLGHHRWLHNQFPPFFYSQLPSGTWWTPSLAIPWCCLPTSSTVCLVFFPLSLCLASWFLPDLINGRHVHTTSVCISLHWSSLCVVQLPTGSWHNFHVGNMVFVWNV